MNVMKIGILGSGQVGQTLARAFKAEGHDVRIATRQPGGDKATQVQDDTSVIAVSFEDAAKHAELAVLCTSWSGAKQAIESAGEDNLGGKTVIDCTNPLKFEDNKGPSLALGFSDSAGEQVQRWLPKSRVVKAFNTIGYASMYKPSFSAAPTMFMCGNDAGAKQTVKDILASFGWEDTVDIGDISGAREIEPLAMLWIKYGVSAGGWGHAFKLLRK